MKNQVNKKVSKVLITLLALVVMSVSCVVLAACNKECTHSNLTSQPDTATCTSGGFITYTCADCGYTYMTATSAKNHTYGDAVKVAATCTTDGYTVSTCTACGLTDKKDIVAATGHDPEEVVTAATCTATGSKVTVCKTCETVIAVESLPALDHNYVKTSEVAATCGADGYSILTCSACGETKTVAGEKATGKHEYVTDSEVAATCASMGYKVEVCSVCGNEHTTVLPKLDHVFGEPETHQATCYEYAYKSKTCTLCGEVEKYDIGTELAEHTYTLETELAATCTQPGQKIEKCTVCGEKKSTFTAVKGHNWDDGTLVSPTCTEPGYRWKKCTDCGEDNKIVVGTALGHDYDVDGDATVVSTVAATCTSGGYDIVKCARCDSTVMTNFTNALEHSYADVEVIAATCTTEGYTLSRCSNCDNEIRTNIVAATGHDMKVETQREATCFEDGYKNMVCNNCGLKSTEFVEAHHVWDEEVSIEEATCTEPEYHYYVCTVCGLPGEMTAFGDPIGEKNESGEYVHQMKWTVEKEANCYQLGLKVGVCEVCGYTEDEELPLTIHTYHIADAVSAGDLEGLEKDYPTLYAKLMAMENGEEYYCSTTAATCTVSGSTIKRCDYCEVRYQDSVVSALGHYFEEETTVATCYTLGYSVMRCQRDGCNVELGDREYEEADSAILHKMTITAKNGDTTKTLYYNSELDKIYTDEAGTEEFTELCNVFYLVGDIKNVFYCDKCGADKGTELYVNRQFINYDTNGNELYSVTVKEVTETTVASAEHNISDTYNKKDSFVSCTEECTLVYYCTICAEEDRVFNQDESYKNVVKKWIYHQVVSQKTTDAACVTDASYSYVCNREDCGVTIVAGDKVNKADMEGKNLYIMTVYTGAEGYDATTDENDYVEITKDMFSSSKLGHNWDVKDGAEYVILDKKTFTEYQLTERTCDTTETLVLAIKCSRCGTLQNITDTKLNSTLLGTDKTAEVIISKPNYYVAVGTINENSKYVDELKNVAHGIVEIENGKLVWTNVTDYYYNSEATGGTIVTCKVGSENYAEFIANAGNAQIKQIVLNGAEGEKACAAYTCTICNKDVPEQHIGNVLNEVVGCRVKQDCVFCGINLKPYAHLKPEYTCVSQKGDGFYYCERCIKIEEEESDYKAVALGKITAHSNVTVTVVANATCTTDGAYKFTCACGTELEKDAKVLVSAFKEDANSYFYNTYVKTSSGTEFALTEAMFAIPALGHDVKVEVVTAATCTTEGAYKLVCNRCGDLEVGEYKLSELAKVDAQKIKDAIIEANKNAQDKVTVTAAMLVIDAFDHDYEKNKTVEPTCTEQGYDLYICKHDSTHTDKRDYVDALDHAFVLDEEHEGKDAATCDNAGKNHYTCSRCSETKTEVVNALGHELEIELGTAFNCVYGYEVTKFTCKREGCTSINAWFAGVELINGKAYQTKVLQAAGKTVTLTEAEKKLLEYKEGTHTYSWFDTDPGEHGAFEAPSDKEGVKTKGNAYWTCSVCGSRDYLRESVSEDDYKNPNVNRSLIQVTVKVDGVAVNAVNMFKYVEATEEASAYYVFDAEFIAAATKAIALKANYTYNGTAKTGEQVLEALAAEKMNLNGELVVAIKTVVAEAPKAVTIKVDGEPVVIENMYTYVPATNSDGEYYKLSDEFFTAMTAALDADAKYEQVSDEVQKHTVEQLMTMWQNAKFIPGSYTVETECVLTKVVDDAE